eukprot:278877_1
MGACGTKLPEDNGYKPTYPVPNHTMLYNESDDDGDMEPYIINDSFSSPNTTEYNKNEQPNHHENNTIESFNPIQKSPSMNAPTYNKLIEMGFDKSLALVAANKYPTEMNDAI